jgi:hypothetical protein
MARRAIAPTRVFETQSSVPRKPDKAGNTLPAQCPSGFKSGTETAPGMTLPKGSRAVHAMLAAFTE